MRRLKIYAIENLFKSCKEAIIGFTQLSISTGEIYVHFSFAIMTFKTFISNSSSWPFIISQFPNNEHCKKTQIYLFIYLYK